VRSGRRRQDQASLTVFDRRRRGDGGGGRREDLHHDPFVFLLLGCDTRRRWALETGGGREGAGGETRPFARSPARSSPLTGRSAPSGGRRAVPLA